MKKTLAKYTSKALAATAKSFATVLKPFYHSPEIPQELRK
ncbi:cyclic lactone autoinducer peptide [Paenibacillus glufosinatiresistens]|nr:cyclic lactone autoinducer peptide [Paenibacillus sp. YX.27]